MVSGDDEGGSHGNDDTKNNDIFVRAEIFHLLSD